MLMATAFFRTIILYLLLIAGLRLTGKRQIGELEPIELVLTMLLSDLASVPMQDFDSPLINGVVPILTLLALTTLLSYISFRSGRFRSLICGEPAIVVRYGKLQQRAMRHNRMTVDELLEELRGQGVTDLKDVQYAVLETSGQVSVLLRPQAQPVTPPGRIRFPLGCLPGPPGAEWPRPPVWRPGPIPGEKQWCSSGSLFCLKSPDPRPPE